MGIHCDINCHADGPSIQADVATAVFRVFQETLTNIAKHADATRVAITLVEDGEILLLDVEDNGSGTDDQGLLKEGSFGVRNMRERIEALGGEFEFDSTLGQGTRVCVTIPMHAHDDEGPQTSSQGMLFGEHLE